MFFSTLLLSLSEIRRNVLRSSLTILGIVIGVASVIVTVTVGNGTTTMVSRQISSLGTNLLMVRPGQDTGPNSPGSTSRSFRVSDAEAIAEQVGSLRSVAPVVSAPATLVVGNAQWSTNITGSTRPYFDASNWELASGRFFNEAEERSGKAVCVIGETVRKELFGGRNPLGNSIRVGQFACEVIGLLSPKAQASFGNDQDDTVIMPLRTVQRRISASQDVGSITLAVADSKATERVKDEVSTLLRERRKLADNEEDDFNIFDMKQVAQTLSSTMSLLTLLLGAVAAVSLLVGGIGIMNIMLVSVTERTREIGIRLAIGALEKDVLLQFLIEAVVLSGLGGIVGITLATLASVVITRLMNVSFSFNVGVSVLAFAFSSAMGVIFGYVPARRAARLNPIDALRYE